MVDIEDRHNPEVNRQLESQVGRRTGERTSMYLSGRDIERHGYTDGLPDVLGVAILSAARRERGVLCPPHDASCRRRMEDAVKEDGPDWWERCLLRRQQEEPAEAT